MVYLGHINSFFRGGGVCHTCARDKTSRAHDLLSHAHDMISRAHEIISIHKCIIDVSYSCHFFRRVAKQLSGFKICVADL